jgi:hypothetical protein
MDTRVSYAAAMKRKISVLVGTLLLIGAGCGSSSDGKAAGAFATTTTATPGTPSTATTTTVKATTTTTPPSTTTAPPSTTSAPSAGTRKNPVPIATDAVVGDGWSARIDSVDFNAAAKVKAANRFNAEPAAGSVYVMVAVTLTYNGSKAKASYGVRFSALGGSNVQISEASLVLPNELDSFKDVFQGGSISGNIAFQVLTSDVPMLVVYAEPAMSFTDSTVFYGLR